MDAPSISPVLQTAPAPGPLVYPQLEGVYTPQPAYNESFEAASNTAASTPTSGELEQEVGKTPFSLSKYIENEKSRMTKERENKDRAQRATNTEDKGNQSNRPTLMEQRIEFEEKRDAKLNRERLARNSETINPENPQNTNEETLRENVGIEGGSITEAIEKQPRVYIIPKAPTSVGVYI